MSYKQFLFTGCRDKVRFTSRADARAEIARLEAVGDIRPGTMRPYPCFWCDGIHLGHLHRSLKGKPSRRRNLIRTGAVLLARQ